MMGYGLGTCGPPLASPFPPLTGYPGGMGTVVRGE